jgi:hypothetical protein
MRFWGGKSNGFLQINSIPPVRSIHSEQHRPYLNRISYATGASYGTERQGAAQRIKPQAGEAGVKENGIF